MEINEALEKLSVTINNYERLFDSKDALETVMAFVKEAQTNAQLDNTAIALIERLSGRDAEGFKEFDTDIYECVLEAKKIQQQR